MKTIVTSTPLSPGSETDFVGFYHTGTRVQPLTCHPSYTFGLRTESENNGACCQTLDDESESESCYYATRCTDGLQVFKDGKSASCDGGVPCVEVPLYEWETSTDSGWSVTLAWCFTSFGSELASAFYYNAMTTYSTTGMLSVYK
ncbi:hypothetical protein ASPVEDRAFT_75034, partial [Aspergillus versicolor CBS 583.65]